ncbi:MAG: hypothetical protein ACJ76P_09585 [Actinomycetota bacterium]
MDEARMQELQVKRKDTGLTDDEADELGRLYAEQAGKPYSNARHEPDPDTPHDPRLPENQRVTGN